MEAGKQSMHDVALPLIPLRSGSRGRHSCLSSSFLLDCALQTTSIRVYSALIPYNSHLMRKMRATASGPAGTSLHTGAHSAYNGACCGRLPASTFWRTRSVAVDWLTTIFVSPRPQPPDIKPRPAGRPLPLFIPPRIRPPRPLPPTVAAPCRPLPPLAVLRHPRPLSCTMDCAAAVRLALDPDAMDCRLDYPPTSTRELDLIE